MTFAVPLCATCVGEGFPKLFVWRSQASQTASGAAYEDLWDCNQKRNHGRKPGESGGNIFSCGIEYLSLGETRRYSVNWLEVLAGAISWGFKSPSPHHILNGLSVLSLPQFT